MHFPTQWINCKSSAITVTHAALTGDLAGTGTFIPGAFGVEETNGAVNNAHP
jgi:hypothetical protein